ncbi:MAG: hypothetical protein ACRDQ2_00135 [Gaiellales bacterium]
MIEAIFQTRDVPKKDQFASHRARKASHEEGRTYRMTIELKITSNTERALTHGKLRHCFCEQDNGTPTIRSIHSDYLTVEDVALE